MFVQCVTGLWRIMPVVSCLLLSGVAQAALYTNYVGTSANPAWDTSTHWQPVGIPAAGDEAWMNTANTQAVIGSGEQVILNNLIVGRHALNVKLDIQGGELRLEGPSSVLFVGQYNDASGFLTLDGGSIHSDGEFAVGVSGPGEYRQIAGDVTVDGRFSIGRYNNADAQGYVVLQGGSLTVGSFVINDYSSLALSGGTLYVQGDQRQALETLVSQEKITADNSIQVTYDQSSHLTAITAEAVITPKEPIIYPNYFGTSDDPAWDTQTNWHPVGVPTVGDEARMNSANTQVVIGSGEQVTLNKLIVGRHALNVKMDVQGGELRLEGPNSILFVGQYNDASGVLTLDGGKIHSDGEFSVGVSGRGEYRQIAGDVTVTGRFSIGRYNNKYATGDVRLQGGTLTVGSFAINDYSALALSGGTLYIQGDQRQALETLVSQEKITSDDSIQVTYDQSARLTAITAKAVIAPQEPTIYSNYFGASDDPAWDTQTNWQPEGVPTVGDEVRMNSANTQAVVGSGEQVVLNKLIVGRHALNVKMDVQGGELRLEGPNSILFVGQYNDASGVLTLDGGKIHSDGEFSVGVSGRGEYRQIDGEVKVTGQFSIGRYNNKYATGYVVLQGGTLTVGHFTVNDYSYLELRGGTLYVQGDRRQAMETLVNQGRIISKDTIKITYEQANHLTVISSSVDGANWDVAGIMSFTEDEVGPRMPGTPLRRGVRTFTPAPVYGVHPRIFFGPEELPAMRDNLQQTAVGQAAMQQVRLLTTLMREGRAAYEAIPTEERRFPDGRSRISNPGLYDRYAAYAELINGQTTVLESYSSTLRIALGSVMALEAFECLIDQGKSGIEKRQTDLAKAMKTWADYALNHPDFGPDDRTIIAGQHMAFAYDLNYNAMLEEQRTAVRKAIGKMIWPVEQFVGITTEGYATTTNWVTINSFVPMMILAIEGETQKEQDGWSTQELQAYFRQIMQANYKFLTYGWYDSGAPYEGTGKNYQYNAMYTAYAKRGYNFHTQPHAQAYAKQFLPAQLQPYGHYVTSYDAIGGSGFDPEIGGMRHHATDVIGVKWAYPDDPAVDFVWRNYVETPYTDAAGNKATYIDVADQKVTPRSTYYNALLSLVIMASDYKTDNTYAVQNEIAQGELTFNGKERGLIITRSGFDNDAMALQFHTRQDTGGHTYGDRNSFNLSALGRVWVRNPIGYNPETQWASTLLVNQVGIPITRKDGHKARQPGRIASYQDQPLATFMTGDATYAYNNEWDWYPRDPGGILDRTGWEHVMETWNDFRHPNNQLTEAYGDIPFFDYGHWRYGGRLEGMLKRSVNNLRQVYRLAGLVRGNYPYVVVADDVSKVGESLANYQWIAQIPEDLTLMPTSQYSGNLDASRDLVLQEPAATGNRRLLIRVLNAEGTPLHGVGRLREDISYYMWGQDRVAKRLEIERRASEPRFRVMLYPYTEGDAIPQHVYNASTGHIQANWPGQNDTLVFEPYNKQVADQTVEITGFRIFRSGTTLIDTRQQVEPLTVR